MRTDWPPEYENHWTKLARKHGIRLPQKATALTTGLLERTSKKLGISSTAFRDWCGTGYKGYVEMNPTWSARATIGLLLEYVDEAAAA